MFKKVWFFSLPCGGEFFFLGGGLFEFRVGSLLRRDDKIGLSDKIEGKGLW